MKFCWATIRVRNLEESLKFYQEIVGIKLDRRVQSGSGVEIAFLGDGETKIELLYDANNKEVSMGQDISLGFEVKSVDEMMDFVKEKGLSIHAGPIQPSPQVRFFYLLNPNGVKIQFVENM